jgi:4-amino-4-deoxychorismate lyase
MTVLVNGLAEERVPALDRGLQYGDGLFETLRLRDGVPLLWDRHWARLQRGLAALAIGGLREEDCLADLQRAAGPGSALAKLIVTRGSGPRGYAPPAGARPTRICAAEPESLRPAPGPLRFGLCRTRVAASPAPGCKHLNRLENVLARAEWAEGWDEGLMRDGAGRVVCGTQSNLILIDGDAMLTPALDRCGIRGTRRDWLLDRLRSEGVAVREALLPLGQLRAAGAWFFCNTRIGLRAAVPLFATRPARAPHPGLLALLQGLGEELDALG